MILTLKGKRFLDQIDVIFFIRKLFTFTFPGSKKSCSGLLIETCIVMNCLQSV